MIFTERTITVRKGTSTINESIILYRGDFQVGLKFTILDSKYKFLNGANLIESEKATYAQLAVLKPKGDNIFSDIVKCTEGSVTFTMTKGMIDELEEVGKYSFQIRLFDANKESRVSIPPVEFGMEVREPVASEDHNNEVNKALTGYSIAKVTTIEDDKKVDTFNSNGAYNKTKWRTGDRISENKLNKVEDALYEINENATKNKQEMDRKISSNYNILSTTKADKNEIFSMKNMGQDIKEAMTGGSVAVVGKNTVLADNIVDGQITPTKIPKGGIKSYHLDERMFDGSNYIVFDYSYNGNGAYTDSHLMIALDTPLPAGTHKVTLTYMCESDDIDSIASGFGSTAKPNEYNSISGWSQGNSYSPVGTIKTVTYSIPTTTDTPYAIIGFIAKRKTGGVISERITFEIIECQIDGIPCEDFSTGFHHAEARYTYSSVDYNTTFINQIKEGILKDNVINKEHLNPSVIGYIDETLNEGYVSTSDWYNPPVDTVYNSNSTTTTNFMLMEPITAPGITYVQSNATSDITFTLYNRATGTNYFTAYDTFTLSRKQLNDGAYINIELQNKTYISVKGSFRYTSLKTGYVQINRFADVTKNGVITQTVNVGDEVSIRGGEYAWFDINIKTGAKYSKLKESLSGISDRLTKLEKLNDDIEVETLYEYNPPINTFNDPSTGKNDSNNFALTEVMPEGYITSIDTGGYSVLFTLYTREGDTLTAYDQFTTNSDDDINDIYVKPNTYFGISGPIGHTSTTNTSDVPNINRFYDLPKNVKPVKGDTMSIVQVSGMSVWFHMRFTISNRPLNKLDSITKSIDKLREEVEALKGQTPGTSNKSEIDILEKQLINVWDYKLDSSKTGWSYSNTSFNSNGIVCSGASKAWFDKYLTFDTFRQKAIVTVTNVNSVFGLVCNNANKGAVYLVDGVNKRISLHAQYTGGSSIPALKASTALPFELISGNKYQLEVFKTGWKHTLTVTDIKTMKSCSVTFDNATQANSGHYCGKGWGGPGVICFSGNVTFNNHRYYIANYKTPRVMFIGDSITEGTNMGAGANIANRWCSLLRSQYFDYDALICGRGGATSGDILSRMNAFDSLNIRPEIVIILDGTNERSDSGLSGWLSNMPRIREKIISWGAKPIICVPPISSSGYSYISRMRDHILEQGWDTIRMDLATTKNNDGSTYDGTLYTDGVHPNEKGSRQMYERAVLDLNLIL